jgi:hypothetical protein
MFHLRKIQHYSAKEKLAYIKASMRAIGARVKSSRERRSPEVVGPAARTLPQHVLLDVHDSDMYGVQQYLPRPYVGTAVVLRPSISTRGAYQYPNRRWAQLIRGGLEIQRIPGDSDSMWVPPDAAGMARAIDACMTRNARVLASECSSKA